MQIWFVLFCVTLILGSKGNHEAVGPAIEGLDD